jgi:hypothetical protein
MRMILPHGDDGTKAIDFNGNLATGQVGVLQ